MNTESSRVSLYNTIRNQVFIQNSNEQIGSAHRSDHWLFDFRRVLMDAQTSWEICELFEEHYRDQYPFQICSLEVAGVPLVSTLVAHMYHKGYTDINGFFIRKSRKKDGLMRMIEGEILPDIPVILVDDLINSGASFKRQLSVTDELGIHVSNIWSVLRFRDMDYYEQFANRGITFSSVFALDDFTEELGDRVKNLIPKEPPLPIAQPFTPEWVFKSNHSNLGMVVHKSQAVLDEQYIYVGSESRNFWCINQTDGSVKWKFQSLPTFHHKNILSSPALHKDLVIFGAYDGNLYALNKCTGKKEWTFWEGDFIGSSPTIAPDLNLVFIGLEFGIVKKKGGIAAINAQTGKLVWSDYDHEGFTHSSPCYIAETKQVVIGNNDGRVRLYDAKTGNKEWVFTTYGGQSYDAIRDGGFSEGDIKESFIYHPGSDRIAFGSIDGFLYIIDRKTGYLVNSYKCIFGIWSTPCIYKDLVIVTSQDKHVHAIDITNGELIWKINPDYTRIFSPPTIINDILYIGTNAARLHEINPETGEMLSYFQGIERITGKVLYNQSIDRYFLPTYANEIIKLKKSDTKAD